MNKPRQKKCRGCGDKFTPDRSFQCVCNPKCAIEYTRNKHRTKKEKEQRAKTRTARELLKTRSDHLKEAQTAFNAYIRQRDAGNACISCERSTGAKINAGHFRSVGAAPHLRFNEDNCHLQCEHCNTYKSGNAIDYRINLIKKIGIDRVEAIESNNEPLKLTIPQIKEIKAQYKAKLKEIKSETSSKEPQGSA